jgi:hypothetical protein
VGLRRSTSRHVITACQVTSVTACHVTSRVAPCQMRREPLKTNCSRGSTLATTENADCHACHQNVHH